LVVGAAAAVPVAMLCHPHGAAAEGGAAGLKTYHQTALLLQLADSCCYCGADHSHSLTASSAHLTAALILHDRREPPPSQGVEPMGGTLWR